MLLATAAPLLWYSSRRLAPIIQPDRVAVAAVMIPCKTASVIRVRVNSLELLIGATPTSRSAPRNDRRPRWNNTPGPVPDDGRARTPPVRRCPGQSVPGPRPPGGA